MSQPMTAPVPESGKPKLLDQVRQRCRVRHLALKTDARRVGWIRRFIFFHQKRHPLEMGALQVSAFLVKGATHIFAHNLARMVIVGDSASRVACGSWPAWGLARSES